MGLSTLILGTALAVLLLVAAGLMAAMVLLERHEQQLAAAPSAARVPARGRRKRCRRACDGVRPSGSDTTTRGP